jgi:hypothetical protein
VTRRPATTVIGGRVDARIPHVSGAVIGMARPARVVTHSTVRRQAGC